MLFPNLCLDFLVSLDGSGFWHHKASLHIIFPHSTKQNAHVISCFCPVQRLAEHLNTWKQKKEILNFVQACSLKPNHDGIHTLCAFLLTSNNSHDVAIKPHKFNVVSHVDDPLQQPACHHCAPSLETKITVLKCTSWHCVCRKVESTHLKKLSISLKLFCFLTDQQYQKHLQWEEGTVYPLPSRAEEHGNPEHSWVAALHSHQDQALYSEKIEITKVVNQLNSGKLQLMVL